MPLVEQVTSNTQEGGELCSSKQFKNKHLKNILTKRNKVLIRGLIKMKNVNVAVK